MGVGVHGEFEMEVLVGFWCWRGFGKGWVWDYDERKGGGELERR